MTENKAIDDLLLPRIIVENNYPRSPFKHHEIIVDPSAQQLEWAKEFPLNFRFLNWWEERQESEMPEYIKFPAWHDENETEFLHVDGKESYHHFNQAGYFGVKHRSGGGFYIGEERSKFLPATEAEYLNYQKQKS